MRLRGKSGEDEAFDGLTAEEVRRIRGAAAANVTPGLEGLHKIAVGDMGRYKLTAEQTEQAFPKKAKRGRRA